MSQIKWKLTQMADTLQLLAVNKLRPHIQRERLVIRNYRTCDHSNRQQLMGLNWHTNVPTHQKAPHAPSLSHQP